MSEEKLYNLLQLDTTGWNVGNKENDVNLTKEECDLRLNFYLSQGVSPDRLKASRYIP